MGRRGKSSFEALGEGQTEWVGGWSRELRGFYKGD